MEKSAYTNTIGLHGTGQEIDQGILTQRSNVSNRFNSLVTAIPGLLNSAVAAGRVRELVELASEHHDEAALSELIESNGITVKLHNVAFSYNENTQIYKDGDFIARPGEIVTILGSSGEGKTTLLRMILGLISPDSGNVTLIGSDGKEMPVIYSFKHEYPLHHEY